MMEGVSTNTLIIKYTYTHLSNFSFRLASPKQYSAKQHPSLTIKILMEISVQH